MKGDYQNGKIYKIAPNDDDDFGRADRPNVDTKRTVKPKKKENACSRDLDIEIDYLNVT